MALRLVLDVNGNPIPIINLVSSEDVDGTAVSALSSVINGDLVRIVSLDNILRVLTGPNPTAFATSIAIPALGELWLPIHEGCKVAVLGGKANISVAEGL